MMIETDAIWMIENGLIGENSSHYFQNQSYCSSVWERTKIQRLWIIFTSGKQHFWVCVLHGNANQKIRLAVYQLDIIFRSVLLNIKCFKKQCFKLRLNKG